MADALDIEIKKMLDYVFGAADKLGLDDDQQTQLALAVCSSIEEKLVEVALETAEQLGVAPAPWQP